MHFLVDHGADDNYFYLLTIHTGMRKGAGTKSNVNFVLVGNDEDSGIRILSDGIKEVNLNLDLRRLNGQQKTYQIFLKIVDMIC